MSTGSEAKRTGSEKSLSYPTRAGIKGTTDHKMLGGRTNLPQMVFLVVLSNVGELIPLK
jgi:hypothetical protein